MTQTSPLAIVEAYLESIAARDLVVARRYLADEHFRYVSPMHSFTSADSFVAYFELVSPIMHHIETRKVFVDGAEVCHILSVTSQISEKLTTAVVQWSRVNAERKIDCIELIFDAHEYKKLLV